ncbi:phosphatidate cytidylyltransferase [Sphingomonas crusticola]|uniref:phosphatidate cytidylyltransferase n=1 Tax=Sphingomonas crusticola TaxID=1697973 RepID=UPI000E26968D|nr:phosphatidate cytidylyltransferase [Sphingomonas crusticola]
MAGADGRSSDLGTRAAIGAALAAGAILVLLLGGYVLWMLLTAGAVLALAEWAGLVKASRVRLGIGALVLLAGLICALPIIWGTDRSSVALLVIAALLIALLPRTSGIALGAAYIGTAAIAILFLREQPHGFLLSLWTLVIVWATDIGAYFAGRRFGGAKLAPAISPNKTWAGLVGGMLAAAIIGGAIAWFGHLPGPALWLGAPLAVAAQLGDLLESWMKRRVDVKDSGKILPGHGGLLDRIDGMLPVVIIVAALVANGNFR